jgi:hypothetical protein
MFSDGKRFARDPEPLEDAWVVTGVLDITITILLMTTRSFPSPSGRTPQDLVATAVQCCKTRGRNHKSATTALDRFPKRRRSKTRIKSRSRMSSSCIVTSLYPKMILARDSHIESSSAVRSTTWFLDRRACSRKTKLRPIRTS